MNERETEVAPRAAKSFYDHEYKGERYGATLDPQKHALFPFLSSMVERYGLRDKKCLEVGCGRGALQDLVDDYTGVDISESVRSSLRKPFCTACATSLPFPDSCFDALWTYAVLEHVPDPEDALREMRRVLKPGGLLMLHAAWHCPFYAAQGYPVRPFHELGLKGKIVKCYAVVDRLPPCRALSILGRRVRLLLRRLCRNGAQPFSYVTLTPNYETFWMSDSDAVNSMDQLEAVLWFAEQGDECVLPETWLRRFLQVSGEIVLRVRKPRSP